ncbi:hypothetical protein B0H17DRAFT_1208410 [Mycena rosella]|uniref:Uncharacterized protein n=1 Tax=Mycena rosella TaxID=1033263 RepID=A0AAD7D0T0_MYCRO|nr:hypothetical protein B0H17DRAFT_1208410 [Mycena rosella]
MRLFSLTSTVSHTSSAQLENIKSQISAISELYKRSPLGRHSQLNFEISDFLRLLKGMNGDHAADVKKTVRLVQAWKDEVCRIMIGYDEFQKLEPDELLAIIREIQKKNLEEAGREEGWAQLSDSDKDTLSKSSMDTLAFHIGDKAFSQLSPEAKCEIDQFFWAGCSMHKETNCCHSFCEEMQDYYTENPDIKPPVLLTNRDNDATVQLAEETGQLKATVQHALKVSERGAVKLISLFGALVNVTYRDIRPYLSPDELNISNLSVLDSFEFNGFLRNEGLLSVSHLSAGALSTSVLLLAAFHPSDSFGLRTYPGSVGLRTYPGSLRPRWNSACRLQ